MTLGPMLFDAEPCPSAPSFEDCIDDLVSRIKESFEQNDYDVVRNLFDTICRESMAEYGTGETDPQTGRKIMEIPGYVLNKLHTAYHIMGHICIAERHLESAERIFQQLEDECCIFNLSVPYNLACIKSLQGKTEEMYAKLRQVLNRSPEDVLNAMNDKDFEPYHHKPEFLKMMHEAKLLSR